MRNSKTGYMVVAVTSKSDRPLFLFYFGESQKEKKEKGATTTIGFITVDM